ncbi:hypothetical protein C8T65DRAFT_651032 [Cerioporus squamosus]|nr:hypothetical protein C8T65DRAFT_651032 [Cerioporus squamosus]
MCRARWVFAPRHAGIVGADDVVASPFSHPPSQTSTPVALPPPHTPVSCVHPGVLVAEMACSRHKSEYGDAAERI